MPTGGKGNDIMENITTINIQNEANITGKGNHRNGNCHAAIATELFEARTSQIDMANYLHTSFRMVSFAVTGRTSKVGVYKRDENGNLRRVGWTRVFRANDPRAIDALLQNGKKLLKENAELKEKAAAWDANKDKLAELNNVHDELSAFRAYKAKKEEVRKLNATIDELKAKMLEAVAELVELEKAL